MSTNLPERTVNTFLCHDPPVENHNFKHSQRIENRWRYRHNPAKSLLDYLPVSVKYWKSAKNSSWLETWKHDDLKAAMSDPNLNNLNCLYVARCLIPVTHTIRGAHLNAWRTSVEVQMALNIEIAPWRQLLILVLFLGLPLPCHTFCFVFHLSLQERLLLVPL